MSIIVKLLRIKYMLPNILNTEKDEADSHSDV